MCSHSLPKATLGRLPLYLRYLKTVRSQKKTISATSVAKALELGEVQVRKDLSAVSGAGKPKVGYITDELIESLENCLGQGGRCRAVIVGAGKLGMALLDYEGFSDYGLEVVAAFDSEAENEKFSLAGKPVFPMSEFEGFCYREDVKIGIITVPKSAAQSVCNLMIKNNISAIWSFAPAFLHVPNGIVLKQENLALSLAHLKSQI